MNTNIVLTYDDYISNKINNQYDNKINNKDDKINKYENNIIKIFDINDKINKILEIKYLYT